jgi:TM2 domain-containing membrane protein YozV
LPYSIIGADEREYGPVEVDTLVKWATEGRVVERTQIKDHDSGRRYLACDMGELSAIFHPPPADLTPAPESQPIIPSYTSFPPATYNVYSRPQHRIVAGVLGIFLGWLGVHRFYLGYTAIGVVQLLLGTVIAFNTCGLTWVIALIWGFVEGIICFFGGMPDADGRPLTF